MAQIYCALPAPLEKRLDVYQGEYRPGMPRNQLIAEAVRFFLDAEEDKAIRKELAKRALLEETA